MAARAAMVVAMAARAATATAAMAAVEEDKHRSVRIASAVAPSARLRHFGSRTFISTYGTLVECRHGTCCIDCHNHTLETLADAVDLKFWVVFSGVAATNITPCIKQTCGATLHP
eukprot:1082-Chlamydomonas_euryale.AAC.1